MGKEKLKYYVYVMDEKTKETVKIEQMKPYVEVGFVQRTEKVG